MTGIPTVEETEEPEVPPQTFMGKLAAIVFLPLHAPGTIVPHNHEGS